MNRSIDARLCLAAILMLACLGTSPASFAKDKDKKKPFIAAPVSPKQSIRFYKANKALQVDRISFAGGENKELGCHNFLKKTRVYKALQIGFGICHLYEKKGCEIGSLIAVDNDDQRHGSFILKEGVAWFPQSDHDQGAKVGSWSCNMEIDQGEMRFEYDLVRVESNRLKAKERSAKEKLEAAQAKFAKAKKATKDAKKYTERVKAEAIDMGVIEPDPEPEEKDQKKGKEKGEKKE